MPTENLVGTKLKVYATVFPLKRDVPAVPANTGTRLTALSVSTDFLALARP